MSVSYVGKLDLEDRLAFNYLHNCKGYSIPEALVILGKELPHGLDFCASTAGLKLTDELVRGQAIK